MGKTKRPQSTNDKNILLRKLPLNTNNTNTRTKLWPIFFQKDETNLQSSWVTFFLILVFFPRSWQLEEGSGVYVCEYLQYWQTRHVSSCRIQCNVPWVFFMFFVMKTCVVERSSYFLPEWWVEWMCAPLPPPPPTTPGPCHVSLHGTAAVRPHPLHPTLQVPTPAYLKSWPELEQIQCLSLKTHHQTVNSNPHLKTARTDCKLKQISSFHFLQLSHFQYDNWCKIRMALYSKCWSSLLFKLITQSTQSSSKLQDDILCDFLI